jgi:hypothetical protein
MVTEDFSKDWLKRFKRAQGAVGEDREAELGAVAELIETGLTCLGASAIEDRLQVGMPGKGGWGPWECLGDVARVGWPWGGVRGEGGEEGGGGGGAFFKVFVAVTKQRF